MSAEKRTDDHIGGSWSSYGYALSRPDAARRLAAWQIPDCQPELRPVSRPCSPDRCACHSLLIHIEA
jgi:hypothetical protein